MWPGPQLRLIRAWMKPLQRCKLGTALDYYCDILEAKAFGQLMWATGCAAQADLTRELVFVCDGAVRIWNLITTHYPKAVQIVD